MLAQIIRPYKAQAIRIARCIRQQAHHQLRGFQRVINPLTIQGVDQRGSIAQRCPVHARHAGYRTTHGQQGAGHRLRLSALPLIADLVGVMVQQLLCVDLRWSRTGSKRAATQVGSGANPITRSAFSQREHPSITGLRHPVLIPQLQVGMDPRFRAARSVHIAPGRHPMHHLAQPTHTNLPANPAAHTLGQ